MGKATLSALLSHRRAFSKYHSVRKYRHRSLINIFIQRCLFVRTDCYMRGNKKCARPSTFVGNPLSRSDLELCCAHVYSRVAPATTTRQNHGRTSRWTGSLISLSHALPTARGGGRITKKPVEQGYILVQIQRFFLPTRTRVRSCVLTVALPAQPNSLLDVPAR